MAVPKVETREISGGCYEIIYNLDFGGEATHTPEPLAADAVVVTYARDTWTSAEVTEFRAGRYVQVFQDRFDPAKHTKVDLSTQAGLDDYLLLKHASERVGELNRNVDRHAVRKVRTADASDVWRDD